MTVLLVNITGPDGKQRQAGEPVPKSWDADYVKSLVKSGGAGTQKAWDERTKANEREAVESLVAEYKAGRLPDVVTQALDTLAAASPEDVDRAVARTRQIVASAAPGGNEAVVAALMEHIRGGDAK